MTKAESAAEQGLMSNATPAEMETLIDAWAETETRLGKSFCAVRAPADVASAIALLARGEIAFGVDLSDAASHLPQTRAKMGAYLERTLGHAKGPAMIDQALAMLKEAGYGYG